jgi:hypothetical protein
VFGFFEGGHLPRTLDVTRDGKQFIVVISPGYWKGRADSAAAPQIDVVLNWIEELKQRVPIH